MPQDDDLKPNEIVIRVLMRVPADMTGTFARPHKDLKDFIRRKSYGKSSQPENGISVFRKSKFKSPQEIYDRIGSPKKLMGLAECTFGAFTAKHLKHKVTGQKRTYLCEMP